MSYGIPKGQEQEIHLPQEAVLVTKNIRDFRGAELQFPGLRVLSPGDLLKEI